MFEWETRDANARSRRVWNLAKIDEEEESSRLKIDDAECSFRMNRMNLLLLLILLYII